MNHFPIIKREASPLLPTKWGRFTTHGYSSENSPTAYIALVIGDVADKTGVLTRVHSVCATGDIFGSLKCDCGNQLDLAMREIANAGGVLIYATDHEGRGIGLIEKLRAYELQQKGLDTMEANLQLGHDHDTRNYGIAAAILSDLSIKNIRLLTNNPAKMAGLEKYGVSIIERVPLVTKPNEENQTYLKTKRDRAGHLLNDLVAYG